MKLSAIYESDFGSKFMSARSEVASLLNKLDRLRAELAEAQSGADSRDFESDKDRGGGAYYIQDAIRKVSQRLEIARGRLARAKDNWDATRSKIGDAH